MLKFKSNKMSNIVVQTSRKVDCTEFYFKIHIKLNLLKNVAFICNHFTINESKPPPESKWVCYIYITSDRQHNT